MAHHLFPVLTCAGVGTNPMVAQPNGYAVNQLLAGCTVSGSFTFAGQTKNFFDPAEGCVPATFGTGNTRSANNVAIKDWVEFGWSSDCISGCQAVNYVDISRSGVITLSLIKNYTAFTCFNPTTIVTLRSKEFMGPTSAGCSLTPLDSTYPVSVNGAISSSEGLVTLTIPRLPNDNIANFSASWQLNCGRVVSFRFL